MQDFCKMPHPGGHGLLGVYLGDEVVVFTLPQCESINGSKKPFSSIQPGDVEAEAIGHSVARIFNRPDALSGFVSLSIYPNELGTAIKLSPRRFNFNDGFESEFLKAPTPEIEMVTDFLCLNIEADESIGPMIRKDVNHRISISAISGATGCTGHISLGGAHLGIQGFYWTQDLKDIYSGGYLHLPNLHIEVTPAEMKLLLEASREVCAKALQEFHSRSLIRWWSPRATNLLSFMESPPASGHQLQEFNHRQAPASRMGNRDAKAFVREALDDAGRVKTAGEIFSAAAGDPTIILGQVGIYLFPRFIDWFMKAIANHDGEASKMTHHERPRG